ncbi:NAD(P)-binding protein [Coniophora puteana RWD-64-598 SS2]|uniref:NAD(P)-binding protein n=1 Tax=Coniophora puteana (strain RWD-64-598) TaxID=741705 RepID=A0A5M3MIE1_CONPW|nr:NAD(P)-binding protein [Coniophora puteana RWD-64-598 SS2]EIW78415.1 NAD(P)-binding protein [Coniophora puteana RWD-64-598 SS2]
MTRTVAVFGATGSAVVKTLLADGTFTPRAITRNASSERAQKLKALGVEVVEANAWDISSLKRALTSCEGVFGVTDYYDPKNFAEGTSSETTMGKNIVDASKETDVKFFIWSSLPHATRVSNGKYRNVHHFDNKANVEEYLQEVGLPHAILHTGWFSENSWNYNCVAPSEDSSSLNVAIPKYSADSPQYILWVERDLGQVALALLKSYETKKEQVLGHLFYAVSAKMTYPEFAKVLERSVGKPVDFISPESTGMQEMDEMYAFQSEFGLYPDVQIPDPRLTELGVKWHTMDEFAQEAAKARYV